MAELEVDQTNLPPIQEVAQYFALLEDGALAHNLQEQEIEQFYSSNVQRNQLVQKDIRVAKRLQNEEHQQAQMFHCQATQQLEEQDSEYAQRIQEEIQQAAKDAQRREEEDEEIAKRIQEEEELLVIQKNVYKRKDNRGLERERTCLDLSEIQQVIQDEELAHRLQEEEEEKLLRQASQFRPSSLGPCPQGDFRVAQVAQDEEIAHFMLEQEMKAQMLPQRLEGYGSEQESRAVNPHDVSDREMHSMGLNSEETVSPGNEFSQHYQPPSAATPVNIAEELDPTFQREQQMHAGQNLSEPCQLQTTSQAWLNGEPTFVVPTKRQNDKSGHVKSKQKRGIVKRKPSCKQQ